MTSVPLLVASGFAGWLAVNGGGTWFDVSGPYTIATEWPFYIGPDQPAKPDRCIMVTPTTVARRGADIMQGIQVRLRGDSDAGKNAVMDQAQVIANLCYPNGFPRTAVDLGYVRAGAVLNGPEAPMGTDLERRFEYVMNYRIRHRRPEIEPPTLLGYSLVAPNYNYVISPGPEVRTIRTMTQAEYDATGPHVDPTEIFVIIP